MSSACARKSKKLRKVSSDCAQKRRKLRKVSSVCAQKSRKLRKVSSVCRGFPQDCALTVQRALPARFCINRAEGSARKACIDCAEGSARALPHQRLHGPGGGFKPRLGPTTIRGSATLCIILPEALFMDEKAIEDPTELIQKLPPQLRDRIYKEFLKIKLRERRDMGWGEVNGAIPRAAQEQLAVPSLH